jgi:hypothetical protein
MIAAGITVIGFIVLTLTAGRIGLPLFLGLS